MPKDNPQKAETKKKLKKEASEEVEQFIKKTQVKPVKSISDKIEHEKGHDVGYSLGSIKEGPGNYDKNDPFLAPSDESLSDVEEIPKKVLPADILKEKTTVNRRIKDPKEDEGEMLLEDEQVESSSSESEVVDKKAKKTKEKQMEKENQMLKKQLAAMKVSQSSLVKAKVSTHQQSKSNPLQALVEKAATILLKHTKIRPLNYLGIKGAPKDGSSNFQSLDLLFSTNTNQAYPAVNLSWTVWKAGLVSPSTQSQSFGTPLDFSESNEIRTLHAQLKELIKNDELLAEIMEEKHRTVYIALNGLADSL